MSSRRTTDDTVKIILVVVAALLLAPMLMMALAFPMMGVWGGMMGGFGTRFSPLWGVGMMLVWLVILVGGGYLVYRWASGAGSAGTDPALEELRMAYARGDLSDEEYEERRSRLGGE